MVLWAQSTTKDYIRAKTNFTLSPIYSSHKSSNHKFPEKIPNQSWHKFTYNKTYTNVKHKIVDELVPSVLPLLKKHIRLGHAGIMDHSIDLSIPDFKRVSKMIQLKKLDIQWTDPSLQMFVYVELFYTMDKTQLVSLIRLCCHVSAEKKEWKTCTTKKR